MARLEGLEPPTFWFVAKRSNPTGLQAQNTLSIVPHKKNHVNAAFKVVVLKIDMSNKLTIQKQDDRIINHS